MPSKPREATMVHRFALHVAAYALAITALAPDIAAQDAAVRGTRVVPDRPARVFVMAGFDTACKALRPVTITIDKAPTQGSVSLREGQQTTIQYSVSGRCIGSRITGTGIYYTAQKSATGTDTFSVTARLGTETASRTFTVKIADD
jgi:hypothetical protein